MPFRSMRDVNPTVIGVVSVLALSLMTVLAFAVGVLHLLERTYTVTAVFSDASGISRGDDVELAGVKVGRVGGVEADRRRGNVRIRLVVRDGIELGADATAEVALKTLLGTKFVRLGGAVRRPYLRDGSVIPIERTRTPFDFFDLTRAGTRVIDNTDTKRLDQLVGQLATVTQDKRQDIQDLLSGLGRVSDAITQRDAQLATLLDRTQTVSGTLADKDRVLVALIDQSAGVLEVLQRNRDRLRTGLEATATLTDQLASLVAQHKGQLDQLLRTLHPTVDILGRRQQDLDRALSWIGPGALGLAQAVNHGPWADIYAVLGSPTG